MKRETVICVMALVLVTSILFSVLSHPPPADVEGPRPIFVEEPREDVERITVSPEEASSGDTQEKITQL